MKKKYFSCIFRWFFIQETLFFCFIIIRLIIVSTFDGSSKSFNFSFYSFLGVLSLLRKNSVKIRDVKNLNTTTSTNSNDK